MFAGERRYDAAALSLADSADDAIQRKQCTDRLRRGNPDCGEGKGLELQAHRRDLLHPFPRGSYQRPAGASAYHGKCGADGAFDLGTDRKVWSVW